MFGSFKRKSLESQEEMHSVQQQLEQFDVFMEDHRVQSDKAMESQKKASNLVIETFSFMMSLGMSQQNPTQYEQAKKKLISCLLAVQEDETLKQNAEVQKLVDDIYRNMDDKNAMMKITSRFETLIDVPQAPDILSSFNFTF